MMLILPCSVCKYLMSWHMTADDYYHLLSSNSIDPESPTMPIPSTAELVYAAQRAGYQVVEAQQIRSNRWLLTLGDKLGTSLLVLVQARPLIVAADVQDLAELVQLRSIPRGLLWAYGGTLSPAAQLTLTELSDSRLQCCTALPLAAQPEGAELVQISTALGPSS